MGLFIDGRLAARDTETQKALRGVFRDFDVRIGKTGENSSPGAIDLAWFDGKMREVELWDRTLTAEEVARQFGAGLGNTSAFPEL